jgi:hypothetical protein
MDSLAALTWLRSPCDHVAQSAPGRDSGEEPTGRERRPAAAPPRGGEKRMRRGAPLRPRAADAPGHWLAMAEAP